MISIAQGSSGYWKRPEMLPWNTNALHESKTNHLISWCSLPTSTITRGYKRQNKHVVKLGQKLLETSTLVLQPKKHHKTSALSDVFLARHLKLWKDEGVAVIVTMNSGAPATVVAELTSKLGEEAKRLYSASTI